MVREALFSLLGNAIPDRIFVDIFGGTGAVGMEALSRGAKATYFIERDIKLANSIEKHLRDFGLVASAKTYRTDAYRWCAAWQAPSEPVNVFLSPPFADLHDRPEVLLESLKLLQERVAPDSIVILQSERGALIESLPDLLEWERRVYGRNVLLIWQKDLPVPDGNAAATESSAGEQGETVTG